jgi:hypothetical protein
MAQYDPIWLDGTVQVYQSSGTTIEDIWIDGESIVIHEYIESSPTSIIKKFIFLKRAI